VTRRGGVSQPFHGQRTLFGRHLGESAAVAVLGVVHDVCAVEALPRLHVVGNKPMFIDRLLHQIE